MVLTLLVYLPSLRPETLWDDNELVFQNALLRNFDGLRHIWFSTIQPDYYPLTWSSFWIEWRLWGSDPLGYRVTNVLLHALAGLLLWRLLLRLGVPGAWLAAALFAVHPVAVASAGWISQRKNTLSMLFFLASAWCFVRWLPAYLSPAREHSARHATRGAAAGPGQHWYWLALAAFVAALLSKIAVVMLPFVLLGVIWASRGHLQRRDALVLAPFLAVGLILGAVGVWFQQAIAIGEAEVRPEGLLSRLAATGWVTWFYLQTAILPVNLAMVYPRWSVEPGNLWHWLPLVGLLGMLALLWRSRHSWGRAPLLAVSYVIIVLAPVLGLLNMAYASIALVSDHLQYLALPGLCALAAYWPAVRWSAASAAARRLFGAAAAALLVCFAALAVQRAALFGNQVALWTDNLALYPQVWKAHLNLGVLKLQAGELPEAERHLRYVIEVKPDFADTFSNYGVLLTRQGRLEEARAAFDRALRLNPNLAAAHGALAEWARQESRFADAERHYRRLVELCPLDPAVHNGLGATLVQLGRPQEAVPLLRRAADLNPAGADTRFNLAMALEMSGDLAAAQAEYRAAAQLDPRDFASLRRLAALVGTAPAATAADLAEALRLAERAVALSKRGDAETLYDYACLLALNRQPEQSARVAREALDVARRRGDRAQIERIEGELGPE